MHVEFFIPLWVFWVLLAYYLLGLILYVPLTHWTAKFISPRRTGRAVWEGGTPKRLFLTLFIGSGFLWPLVLKECIHLERKYG